MKNNKGFSLVELVIVIAIMAILVGVAVPVFSAYVEKSEKAMDKDMVAGIMDAIKKGTNSQMFVSDDSFKMGSLSYPVGFIVLTKDGVRVVASETEVYPATTGKCVFETKNIYALTSETYTCNKGHSSTKTICVTEITYCTTHTPESVFGTSTGGSYSTGFNLTKDCSRSKYSSCNGTWTEVSNVTIPNGATYCPDASKLYTPHESTGMCNAAYYNQYGTLGTTMINDNVTSGPLYDALVAAYGENMSDLKLTYDGWTSTEGVDYATFYISADDLMGSMEGLSGMLSLGSQYQDEIKRILGVDLGVSQEYEDGEAVLAGVASNITTTHADSTSWMNQWNNDSAMTWDSYGFGLAGRENYSAARMAYNNAFASYLEAKGETAHLATIRDFYAQAIDVDLLITEIHIGLPGLICSDAFTASDSPLKTSITDPDELQRLHDLYKEYMDSDAYIENGKLAYEVMKTFNDTSDIAQNYVDQTPSKKDTIFNYYNMYVDEMALLYEKAQTLGKDGIVIIVTVTDGELDFVVSPSEADPRKG